MSVVDGGDELDARHGCRGDAHSDHSPVVIDQLDDGIRCIDRAVRHIDRARGDGGAARLIAAFPPKGEERRDGLRRRGHLVAQAPEIGRGNAVYCREGMQENAAGCSVSADHRGHGLASFVQFE